MKFAENQNFQFNNENEFHTDNSLIKIPPVGISRADPPGQFHTTNIRIILNSVEIVITFFGCSLNK